MNIMAPILITLLKAIAKLVLMLRMESITHVGRQTTYPEGEAKDNASCNDNGNANVHANANDDNSYNDSKTPSNTDPEGETQPQGRRHRAGPRPGLHGLPPGGLAPSGAEAHREEVGRHGDVHGLGDGRGRGLGERAVSPCGCLRARARVGRHGSRACRCLVGGA